MKKTKSLIKLCLILLYLINTNLLFCINNKEQETFNYSSKLFNQFLEKNKELRKITGDISYLLEAKKNEYNRDFGNADRKWIQALESVDEHLKNNFISEWVNSIKKRDPQTNLTNQQILRYASKINYFNPVNKLLQKNQNNKRLTDIEKTLTRLLQDSYLKKQLKLGKNFKLTTSIIEKRSENSVFYKLLLATIYDSKKQQEKTISLAERIIPQLLLNNEPRHLVFNIYRLLIKNQRHTGRRYEAAESYQALCTLWLTSNLNRFPNYMTQKSLLLDMINDFLWSARYQALTGNKKLAILHSDIALNKLKKNKKVFLQSHYKKKFTELFFESYYVKSFKISLYFNDYSESLKWTKEALTHNHHMSKKWKNHFWWLLGFNYFLSKDYKKAHKSWLKQLKSYGRNDYKAKTLYWLTRTSKKLKDKTQKEKYQKQLNLNYPFDFYTLYFYNSPVLLKNVKNPSIIEEERLSSKINKKNKLLVSIIRSELLIESKLFKIAQLELKNAFRLTTPRNFTATNLDFYLYFNKLLNKAKLYKMSIQFTKTLSIYYPNFWNNNPEQIKLFYPYAYKEEYQAKSNQYSVDIPTLLAITHQESLFDSSAHSYANALGLMQITPKTGLTIAKQLKFPVFNPTDDLKKVDINIKIGRAYLNNLDHYYNNNIVAILASYNAGEYCVDQWLKNIKTNDFLTWIELIPFSETKKYVKTVLATKKIYEQIFTTPTTKITKLLKYTKKYYRL